MTRNTLGIDVIFVLAICGFLALDQGIFLYPHQHLQGAAMVALGVLLEGLMIWVWKDLGDTTMLPPWSDENPMPAIEHAKVAAFELLSIPVWLAVAYISHPHCNGYWPITSPLRSLILVGVAGRLFTGCKNLYKWKTLQQQAPEFGTGQTVS